ncbi:unnamed protein product [Rotaria socialis]|uniref:NAD(+)--protein-arginine ADP-ribosyltransferase n=2 Tax=Rotaria socialis TaxID=392032 RepID=A0A817KJH2_9BILA|nr:unnamed protein product [Rotaria socialis]CAF3332420.1 unnamed protein product [Rotaria socialis]CAF3374106.1 unnamed protein product [Rotaria socialis]CAF3578026.1 unnamed protein product [Rotaria socialis]CAF4135250.1 unnamed protein product [Rotaria socialis]
MRRLPPLRGFENMPLVSLEEATQPLLSQIPEIEHMVFIIQENRIQPNNGLTIDESSSIALYSMEWSPRKDSFYIVLHGTLRNANREALLPCWHSFLKLFLTALSKLPPTGRRTIYRGVRTVGVLGNGAFFGKSESRTLFAIECDTGEDIRQNSFYQNEDDILLLRGREFEIMSSMGMDNKLTMVQLKEVMPRFSNKLLLHPRVLQQSSRKLLPLPKEQQP